MSWEFARLNLIFSPFLRTFSHNHGVEYSMHLLYCGEAWVQLWQRQIHFHPTPAPDIFSPEDAIALHYLGVKLPQSGNIVGTPQMKQMARKFASAQTPKKDPLQPEALVPQELLDNPCNHICSPLPQIPTTPFQNL